MLVEDAVNRVRAAFVTQLITASGGSKDCKPYAITPMSKGLWLRELDP